MTFFLSCVALWLIVEIQKLHVQIQSQARSCTASRPRKTADRNDQLGARFL